MQTEREYLVGLGLAKPGVRGRFSLAGKEALAKARRNGVKFASSQPAKPAKPTEAKATPVKEQPVKLAKQDDPANFYTHLTLPHGMFKFYVGDTEITDATACRNCGVSLVVCHCEVPEVVWIGNRGDGAKVRRVAARNV